MNRPAERPTVAVVLPLLNEAAVLPSLMRELRSVLESLPCQWRILLVNDGSTDDSPYLLDQWAASDRRVQVIHLTRNFGHSAAVRAGLDSVDADAVVLMDSDGQDDVQAIKRFYDLWQRGFDVVYAVRFARKEKLWKRVLFSSFYQLLSRVSSVPIPRDAGNFSLLDRQVVQQLRGLSECDRYLPGLRSWVGFRQTSVRVERLARHDGNPRVRLKGLVSLAKTALFGFSRVPLHAFYVLALLCAVVSAGSVAYAVFHKLYTGLAIPGWASITSVTSFFGAMNALGIAILGEYVSRIYDQVRGRPSYIIARCQNIGSDDEKGNRMSSIPREEEILRDCQSIETWIAQRPSAASPNTEHRVPAKAEESQPLTVQ